MEPKQGEDMGSVESPVIDDNYISEHNEGDTGYELGPNSLFDGVNLVESRRLFKNYFNQQTVFPKCSASKNKDTLPENFNWQDQHPECSRRAFNQELCSSGWAVATISTFNDRF